MPFAIAIFFGLSSSVASILLHQSLAPLGVILGVILSYFSIWYVGRYTGKRIFKLLAALIWALIMLRAGTYGVGRELLVQGDSAGASLLIMGLVAVTLATYRRA
jgi:hypothetical protein